MMYPKPHEHNEEGCVHCEVYADIKLEELAEEREVIQINYQLQVEADNIRKYGFS